MMDVDIQANPYKNSACKRCNEFMLSRNNQKSSRFVTTYRGLFSFSELFSNKMKTFGKGCSELKFRDVFESCCLYFQTIARENDILSKENSKKNYSIFCSLGPIFQKKIYVPIKILF